MIKIAELPHIQNQVERAAGRGKAAAESEPGYGASDVPAAPSVAYPTKTLAVKDGHYIVVDSSK